MAGRRCAVDELHVCVADDIKSVDTVDRDMSDCVLGRLGLPEWLRKMVFLSMLLFDYGVSLRRCPCCTSQVRRGLPSVLVVGVLSQCFTAKLGIVRSKFLPTNLHDIWCVEVSEASLVSFELLSLESAGPKKLRMSSNHITKNLTDELYSKSVLRHIVKGQRERRISDIMSDHSFSS